MLVILLNCVTLGMFHPCEDINCDSERCKILQVRPIFWLDHASIPSNDVVNAKCENDECQLSLFSTSLWLNCCRGKNSLRFKYFRSKCTFFKGSQDCGLTRNLKNSCFCTHVHVQNDNTCVTFSVSLSLADKFGINSQVRLLWEMTMNINTSNKTSSKLHMLLTSAENMAVCMLCSRTPWSVLDLCGLYGRFVWQQLC